MPPVPAAIRLVLFHADDVRQGVHAVLAVHAAVKLDGERVIGDDIPVVVQFHRPEAEGIAPALVLVREFLHVHDISVGRHRADEAFEGFQSLVHFVDLLVQEVNLVLHGDQFVPDELSASAGQESGRQDTCCDVFFHFHGLFLA